MELTVKQQQGIYLIEASGDLDITGSIQLKDVFMKLLQNTAERFIISLKGVRFMDSSGIGALLFIASTVKKMALDGEQVSGKQVPWERVPFVLIDVQEPVRLVIERTKLSDYLPITTKLPDALANMEPEDIPEL
ncbi:anti-sigma factor antagonist [Spirochaetia bacterium]|nr:anti-sigma factor antagonist [Spirochaetia bacterium]